MMLPSDSFLDLFLIYLSTYFNVISIFKSILSNFFNRIPHNSQYIPSFYIFILLIKNQGNILRRKFPSNLMLNILNNDLENCK